MFGLTDLSFNVLTGEPFLTALFLILFIAFAVYLYRRTNPPLPLAVKIILGALRIIAVIALFLALFEPVLSYKREYARKPRLTILADRSGSMDIIENGLSRQQRADSLLSAEPLDNLEDYFDVKNISFAGDIFEDGKIADKDKTSLGEVLQSVSEQEPGEPSEYWLILTDGINNSGISPVETAAKIKTPIYAVGVGMQTEDKDIAVTGIDYNNIIYAGKPTEITVHLEWNGLSNEQTRIQIKSGGKILQRETVTLASGNLKEEFRLKFIPERPGRQTFEVAVPEGEGEISDKNNRRSFSATVMKSKMNVLLVAEHPDWEYAFLNRFLDRSESVALSPVVFKKDGGYLTGQIPSQQAEINKYDLIILYDIVPGKLASKAELFRSYLKDNAGGLFVILGQNYLRAGYPRWLDEFLPLIARRSSPSLLYYKFNGEPSEDYLFHPAVRIADTRSGIREGWREMPHFEALVPIDSVGPDSEVLVATGTDRNGQGIPILGYRRIGPGKVLASAALPFWHWAFFGYGFGDDNKEYRMLFDGIVNWLALKEESDPVRIVPDKDIYTRGEAVGFTAFVYDLGFRPIKSSSGYVALINEESSDSTVVQLIESGDGQYRADFDIIPSGRYKYYGAVDKEGKRLKESNGEIVVESYSIEEYRRKPDFAVLTAISQMTGGNFFTPDNIDSLYAGLKKDRIQVSVQKEIVLWNKFWLLTVFILALGLEWLLRKRYQLI